MKITRRVLALLLALTLLTGNVITPVLATEPAAEETAVTEETVAVTEVVEEETEETPAETPVETTEVVAEVTNEAASDAAAAAEEKQTTDPNYVDGSVEYTMENPLYLTWEMNEDGTEATATMTIAAGVEKVCYAIDKSGALYFGNVFAFNVFGTADAPLLNFMFGKADAEITCKMTLKIDAYENLTYPEWSWNEDGTEATATIELPQGSNYVAIPYSGYELLVNGNSVGELDGTEEDPVIFNIYVEKGTETDSLKLVKVASEEPEETEPKETEPEATEPEATEPVAGSSYDNPLYPEWVWSEDETEATANVEVPAGEVYIAIVYSLDLYMGNQFLQTTTGNPRAPQVLMFKNPGPMTMPMRLVVPKGAMNNPAELMDGENTASVAAGSQGYYYTYTAAERGTVTMEIAAESGWCYAINNMTTGVYGDTQWSDSDPVVNPAVVTVNKGDVLHIMVNTYDPADMWNAPAGDITLNVSFEAAPGTKANPIYPEFVMNENNEIDCTVVVPANTTNHYCAYGISGMLMSINGEEPVLMTAEGIGRVPVNFAITNDTDAEAEYVLHLEYPVGNSMNPAELAVYTEGESWDEAEGQNVAEVEADNWSGYVYTWIAPADGELTITMSNGKAGWFYTLSNITAGIYGDYHYSTDAPAVNAETITVNAGDEIQLMVNSCAAPGTYVTPAGDIYFNAYFAKTVGTEASPYVPAWNWNEAWTEATAVVTVPAGVTYFIEDYISGMMLSINGGEAELMTSDNPRQPVVFTITNEGEEAADYNLHICYPEGTMANPADIDVGTTVVELEQGNQGAYYTFIAPERGEVIVTINDGETGWQYNVNNVTTSAYGDYHWSDEYPLINSEVISVNKGDELTIFVITYDPADMWSTPAGTISFDVSFEAAEGTESNPIWIMDPTEWNFNSAPAGAAVHYSAWGIGGMRLMVYPYTDGITVELNGETYVPNKNGIIELMIPATMGRMPSSFAIVNSNDYPAEYEFILEYPVGSMNNPVEMVIGKNTASVEANSQGYFYRLYVERNGFLTISMTGKNWTYSINHEYYDFEMDGYTTSYGDIHVASDGVKTQTIAVQAGDVIDMVVGTEDWEAGKVTFTAAFNSNDTDLLSGKSATLKFTDPATGKTVSGSKVNWQIVGAYDIGADVSVEDPSTIASINSSGKITAQKGINSSIVVFVHAELKDDPTVTNDFNVYVRPAVTSVQIWKATDYYNEEEGYWIPELYEDVTGDTIDMIVNGDEWYFLQAVTDPDQAWGEVTWKSSNPKILDVSEYGYLMPVYDEKTDTIKSGTVTITATAKDGSGKKATVKIKVSALVDWIDVTTKTGNYVVGSGKSLNMVANVSHYATNKKVDWSIKMWDENYENLIDVPKEIATINASGKLTAGKGLTERYEIVVMATAQDGSGVVGETSIMVMPVANKVMILDVPTTIDISSNPYAYLYAEVLDAEGNYISSDVSWKSSNPKIAAINEWGELECLKAGSITLTATANDGSNKKATLKITVVKSPYEVQLPSRAVVAAGKTADLSNPIVLEEDASNKKLNWSFENPELAAVLGLKVSNGKISTNAKKIEQYLTENNLDHVEMPVTATAVLGDSWGNYASDTCILMIYPATKSVSICSYGEALKTANVTGGESLVLYAESAPYNSANKFSWKSSNEKLATVEYNADGSVTVKAARVLKAGKVTITATAVDGTNKKASITVNVVPDVEALGLDGAVILSGKTINMSKNLFFLDWNDELETMDFVTPASKDVVWTLSLADYSDGTGMPTFIPCENNTCYAGTLNAETGVFKAAKVTEPAYCFVTATYTDENGNEIVSNGAQITVSHVALKGINIYGCEGTWDDAAAAKVTGKTVTTTTGKYIINLVPTNPVEDYVPYMWGIELSDWENFMIDTEQVPTDIYDEEGNVIDSYIQYYPVIVPVEDGDPYGTVKVTVIAEGGTTKKANLTIKFEEPVVKKK